MLDLSPLLVLSSAATFLVVLLILNSILYRPLVSFMDKRSADIKRDLDNAQSNDDEVKALLAEADSIIAEAKSESYGIKERAIQEFKDMAEATKADKVSSIEEKFAEFEKSFANDCDTLKNELLAQTPSFKSSVQTRLSQL